jgi:diacylglycerol O-acyltransferase
MTGHYERLSALDAAFLDIETPSCHMHVGVTLIFDAGPLTLEHGGVDIERIRHYVEAAVSKIPRYRQRIQHIPLHRHPVWVDDDGFNINYHVRHSALPRPGSMRQLKRLAARINSQKLDRSRPLWELWVVEGLEDNKLALIGKVHHCMMDGVSGVDVMAMLFRLDAKAKQLPEAEKWVPRPAPGRTELLGEEMRRRGKEAKTLWNRLMGAKEDPQRTLDELKSAANNVLSAMGGGVVPASKTPLNPHHIGAYRRFDWLSLDLEQAKTVKRAAGGTINDVVLATVTGALRRFFIEQRKVDATRLEYRTLIPVNARNGRALTLGNKVAAMLTRLPLEQEDTARRLQSMIELTREAKDSGQYQGSALVEELGDFTAATVISQAMRLATRIRSYNLVVTNVPGPPVPLYLLGARLLEAYPIVPLYLNHALGIAVFSYCGRLYWGLNADWDSVADLHRITDYMIAEFEALKDAFPKTST